VTDSAAPTPAAVVGVDTSSPEVIVTGLQVPWGLAFLPGGDALVTERDTARLLRVPAGGGRPVELARYDDVDNTGEGGLMGLATSPSFAEDNTVYAYYTGPEDNRVVRFDLDDPADREPVVTGIPKGRVHNGGRIAFGPDGNLYVGTGDSGDTSLAQDDDSLGGKVLRVTPDGEPVEGDSPVFSKGHRNVQGLAFDDDGRVYSVEFGQNEFDEVNQISQGANGGWPEVEGPGDGGGRFLAPITTWQPEESSPSGGAILGDTMYVAALRGQRLWTVPLDGVGGAGEPQAALNAEFGRLRSVETAPDGALWVLTSNRDGRGSAAAEDDRIVRLPPR
jgi:glucose/arabinose dehydrogenase